MAQKNKTHAHTSANTGPMITTSRSKSSDVKVYGIKRDKLDGKKRLHQENISQLVLFAFSVTGRHYAKTTKINSHVLYFFKSDKKV